MSRKPRRPAHSKRQPSAINRPPRHKKIPWEALIGASAIIIAAIISGIFLLQSKGFPLIQSATATPTPVPSPPVLLQSSLASSTASTSSVQFTQEPVRQADLILVAITQAEREVLDLKDSQGDVWNKVGGTFANPSKQDYVELYYFQNVKGGTKTSVTVTFSTFKDPGRGSTNVGIYEYAGLSPTSPELDGDAATSNNKMTTNISIGRTLTTANNGICFAVGVDSGPDNHAPYDHTVSPGAEYTLLYPHTAKELSLDDANARERFFTEAASVKVGGCVPNFSIASASPSYRAYMAIVAVSLKP